MDRGGEPTSQSVAEDHSSNYRTLAVFWTRAEAELARGVLEADGVPVAFLDAATATLFPGTAPLRLMVPAADLERARLLLGSPGEVLAAPSAEAEGGRLACGRPAWLCLALATLAVFAVALALALAL